MDPKTPTQNGTLDFQLRKPSLRCKAFHRVAMVSVLD